MDEGQSPDQSENNINDINVLEFYHVIRWNLVVPVRMEGCVRDVTPTAARDQRTMDSSTNATLARGDPRRLLTAHDVEQDQHIQGRYR